MNAIDITNLTKSFHGLHAVDHLSMTVPAGAIYGFIGENGSGKSTTEKLICGLIQPSGGSIKLFGREHTNEDVRSKIGIIAVFVPIAILAAVFAKQKTWLGILIGAFAGILLYMMIPMMTPLNAKAMHAFMCLAGGAIFSIGLGAAGTLLLKKRDLA